MRICSLLILISVFFSLPTGAVAQNTESRFLSLYNTKTKKSLEITFWHNEQYDKKALRKINYFLRDWRNQEVRPIDPELLTLLFNIKQKTAEQFPDTMENPVHVISGHRSFETNRILAWKGRNVAQNSMHTRGQAIDFKIPGVPAKALRDIAKSFNAGGVGYYAGEDFIHIDTGKVRHW